MADIRARDPKTEAYDVLPPGHHPRLLEPSPPANTDPAWMADDPTARGAAQGVIVSPVSDGDRTWSDMAALSGEIAEFARERWLGPRRRLQSLPANYRETRDGLHQLSFFCLSALRYEKTGKLGLRHTKGGLGTPFFGRDEQVRVEGLELVWQRAGDVSHEPFTSVGSACSFLQIPYREVWFDGFHDPLLAEPPDRVWDLDPAAAEVIADWFGFSTSVLEELRRIEGAVDPARVQLWPEHFDPAVELGDVDLGTRASYGASTGDDSHAEPYLYVAAWGEPDRNDPYWKDEAFNGASLTYGELRSAEDPFSAALDFFRYGHQALAGSR